VDSEGRHLGLELAEATHREVLLGKGPWVLLLLLAEIELDRLMHLHPAIRVEFEVLLVLGGEVLSHAHHWGLEVPKVRLAKVAFGWWGLVLEAALEAVAELLFPVRKCTSLAVGATT